MHVKMLVGVAGSAELPPILVQRHGSRVIDGMHRVEAAKLRGARCIEARFLDCTDEEALVLAIKSNTAHGLPLSKPDRLCGATRLLTDHPDWSDRAIASIAGLSAKTIASLRSRSAGCAQQDSKRLGRDGRRRPLAPAEGRRRVAEYIGNHPDAPMREVAREADVSLSTVHAVCTRIRHGAEPAPQPAGPHALAKSAPAQPAQRKNADAAALKWQAIAAKLASDPTIRYTEDGKAFLRWMTGHAAHADQWRELADAIPVHWLTAVAAIADNVSNEWHQFAAQLRGKDEVASLPAPAVKDGRGK
jgi:ParB-like chromosome segregation protein Spo0J